MTAVSSPVRADRRDHESTSEVPRLLIVSPVAPVPEGVGGVYLRDLCLMCPADKVGVAIVPGIGHGAGPASLIDARRVWLELVRERGV